MILKGSSRANGANLATHLMRADENEHVDVHELRGFVGQTLHAAFAEAEAVSKASSPRPSSLRKVNWSESRTAGK